MQTLRAELAEAPCAWPSASSYGGAGTVEFVFDDDTRRWYFLEMNTRIQVEHPVTEMITGRDLVVEQIRIAAGAPISFTQAEVQLTGHAIECRINAEDASTATSRRARAPAVLGCPRRRGMRVDTHCYAGYLVPPYYDSLLAKIIVHGADREQALAAHEHGARPASRSPACRPPLPSIARCWYTTISRSAGSRPAGSRRRSSPTPRRQGRPDERRQR